MTEVPKIVYDRLRAARPHGAAPTVPLREQAHPDANLLTAFAEKSLSATEREGVLDHLAVCGDCRDVIALALPVADFATTPVTKDAEAGRSTGKPAKNRLASGNFVALKTNWLKLVSPRFSGSGLRWAAVAAGIAVVASVLLVRPGRLNQSLPLSANRQVASTAPPASGTQIASSSVPAAPIRPSPMSKVARPSGSRPKSEMQMQLTMALKANQTGTRAPLDAYAGEGVADAGAAAAVRPESSADKTLMARNDAPAIEKAKPALQSSGAGSGGAKKEQNTEQGSPGQPADEKQKDEQKTDTVPRPNLSALASRKVTTEAQQAPTVGQVVVQRNATWTIVGGVLHRSLDGGYSWQLAVHANQPLICVASQSDEVWTGGAAGTLLHSANGGLTWLQIHPSIKAQQLSWDITRINLRGAEVVVSGSNNQMWSSADGGKTWHSVE